VIGDLPIQRRRELERHEGAVGPRKPMQELRVLPAGLDRALADLHAHAMGRQLSGATPSLRTRIWNRRDDLFHPGSDEGGGAWWLLALVVTGLERHHDRGAPGPVPGGAECLCLGMRATEFRVVSFPSDLAVPQDNRPDHRVRTDTAPALPSQFQCPAHRVEVVHTAEDPSRQAG
jgi:hypothetical protein